MEKGSNEKSDSKVVIISINSTQDDKCQEQLYGGCVMSKGDDWLLSLARGPSVQYKGLSGP